MNNMIYIKIGFLCIFLYSCKKENLDIKKDPTSSITENDDIHINGKIMNSKSVLDLKKRALAGDKSAIFSLFNYYNYGLQDYEKAFYWGLLHDRIDKGKNLSILAEDNIKSEISETDMKKFDSIDVESTEIPNIK